MKYLLDTNALIGLLFKPDILSKGAYQTIQQSDSLYISIASLWEIGIKQSIGKIDIDASAEEIESVCMELTIHMLPISVKHIDRMKLLPMVHKDPFDRIIIAQAAIENMTLITRDSIISQYKDIKTLW